jgi:hypothetical protein
VEVKPFFLAGFCIALLVSVLAGIQIAYYFGYERAITTTTTATTTLPVPVSNSSGNFWISPPYPQILVGNISWNTTTISQNQTIEVKESIINPLFANTTVVVPYEKCVSGMMLSMSNGTPFFGPGFETSTCSIFNLNDTMKPGQSSNVTYIVGFKDNIPPLFDGTAWGDSGNSSNFVYWWPILGDIPSGQYELAVEIFRPNFSSTSMIIPISIIT